ncbi:hypothetical protein KAR91_03910 [Candidatus Pacearchaeota archaeon]|nr:hypothetical protein [Candidatus Pacearchaeota archaeon]
MDNGQRLFSQSEAEEMVKDMGTYKEPPIEEGQDHWTLLGAQMADDRKEVNFDRK